MSTIVALISEETIQRKIYFLRGKKIMLDSDLAILYGVPTEVLNQAVKRNKRRFPGGFVFQLSQQEVADLRSQFVISKKGRGGRRYAPYAFTEHGVAMLSSVLKSERAIQVNIRIIEAFIKLREMLMSYKDLREKIAAMEKRYDGQFVVVFKAIKQLLEPSPKSKKRIGFHP